MFSSVCLAWELWTCEYGAFSKQKSFSMLGTINKKAFYKSEGIQSPTGACVVVFSVTLGVISIIDRPKE